MSLVRRVLQAITFGLMPDEVQPKSTADPAVLDEWQHRRAEMKVRANRTVESYRHEQSALRRR